MEFSINIISQARPVVDYRKLNERTILDRLLLPVISDILHGLGIGNKYFSTIDIKSAFWQIELDEGSKDFTAFSTPTGHYECLLDYSTVLLHTCA